MKKQLTQATRTAYVQNMSCYPFCINFALTLITQTTLNKEGLFTKMPATNV